MHGYTLNKRRLQDKQNQLDQLKNAIALTERTIFQQSAGQVRNLLEVLNLYALGLDILDDYDHEKLEAKGRTETQAVVIETPEFLSVVEAMRRDFDSAVFGKPKDSSFDSSARQIYQTTRLPCYCIWW